MNYLGGLFCKIMRETHEDGGSKPLPSEVATMIAAAFGCEPVDVLLGVVAGEEGVDPPTPTLKHYRK